MMTFEAVYAQVRSIKSWMTRNEAQALYWLATQTHAAILELGTYHGRSTLLLALASGQLVVTVDIWDEAFKIAQSNFSRYSQVNIRQFYGNSTCVDIHQQTVKYGPYGLLYVDANHSYAGAKLDLLVHYADVRPGGIIACHDMNHPKAHPELYVLQQHILVSGLFEQAWIVDSMLIGKRGKYDEKAIRQFTDFTLADGWLPRAAG